jgi:Mn-dependent DtxR family transcriptional regulator
MRLRTQRERLGAAEDRVYRALEQMLKLKKYEHKNPSHQEIADRLGVSAWAVSKQLNNLANKGYVFQRSNRRRSTQLIG